VKPLQRGALALAAAVTLASLGCGGGLDHERLGDRRYAERAWLDALAEYRMAARQRTPTAELRAKLAAAALEAGALQDAAREYRDLARKEPASAAEAAEGLVRTFRRALRARDLEGLRAAAAALSEVAPRRPIGALTPDVINVIADAKAPDPTLLLAAAAAATGPLADSLVVAWADAVARLGGCDSASRAYDAVLRRSRISQTLARQVRSGQAGCRLEAGRTLLAAGQLDGAEEAFRAAIAIGTPDSTVRLAWVLLGDARWADGDSTAAAEAYRKAISGGDENSAIVLRALGQLARLIGSNSIQP
jgi:tetratricopeptide (TPR) repeat protein